MTPLLAGVRVIDATAVILGPYASQILGDMGADVIKLEPPDGDMIRHGHPQRAPGMGAIFLTPNRNKRSLALDLKAPGAHDALMRLVATSDVFLHNMRHAAIKTLGLTFDRLRQVNERLIYCAAWGFGRTGPYAGRPAFDDVIQALSGMADLEGKLHGVPSFVPTTIADKVTGLTATYAIAMALFNRERTGKGCEIEVPMLETMTSFLLTEHFANAVYADQKGGVGYKRQLIERGPYRTANGYMAALPYSRKNWARFFEAVGRPELAVDPRVTDDAKRSAAVEELYAILAEILPAHTTEEWLRLFEELDIPAARMNTIDDILTDPHLAAVGFFQEMAHPSEGTLRVPGIPVRIDGEAGTVRRLAPRLGEHTREVLAEAGLSDAEIDALCRSGAARDGR
ncbi:MAG TPA: CoA transferase [Stellaceae bacterium]|nr:CoA transferase [Stellaceae bacterium]